jgi:outer membrane lipopolysaccharide assembly protein LptE/RlpB
MKVLAQYSLPLGLMLLIISGCGFHLRGTSGGTNYKLPFKKVYIDCGTVVICPNLNSAIKTQELATIVTKMESADAVIRLVKEDTSRDAQSFTNVGRVSAYMLTYQVTVEIIQNHQKVGKDIVVSSQSVMQYNDSTLLSNNQNEVTFWDQLHEQATNQLVQRLIFFKPSPYDKQ